MRQQTTDLAAYYVARRLTKMVAPVLLPAEQKSYFREAYRIISALLESCKEFDGRVSHRLLIPSMN